MTMQIKPKMRFNKLTTVEVATDLLRRGQYWICRCDCGGTTSVRSSYLRDGTAMSCGCAKKGINRKHGMVHTPEYKAWDNARSRCYRVKDRKYPLYGGRGITMCDRWRQSFANFYEDLGRRPSDRHSLDRINSNGNYEPGNCRWATIVEQNNNRSINRRLVVDGRTVTVAEAARLTGIPHATILGRLDGGKSDAEAIKR